MSDREWVERLQSALLEALRATYGEVSIELGLPKRIMTLAELKSRSGSGVLFTPLRPERAPALILVGAENQSSESLSKIGLLLTTGTGMTNYPPLPFDLRSPPDLLFRVALFFPVSVPSLSERFDLLPLFLV